MSLEALGAEQRPFNLTISNYIGERRTFKLSLSPSGCFNCRKGEEFTSQTGVNYATHRWPEISPGKSNMYFPFLEGGTFFVFPINGAGPSSQRRLRDICKHVSSGPFDALPGDGM